MGELRGLVAAGNVIEDDLRLAAYETDALTAYRRRPLAVVLPETTAEVAAILEVRAPRGRENRAARRGDVALGRRDPRRGRHRRRPGQVQQDRRDRLREPLRGRAKRRHESRHQPRCRRRGLLLCAGSVEPDRVHDRRQRRRELGRRPLLEVRVDDEQRARRRARHAARRRRASRRQASRQRPLRSARADRRLGRFDRHRHGGHGADLEAATDGARAAHRFRQRRIRGCLRCGDHCRRHHPRRHGDDGQARDSRRRKRSSTSAIRSTSRRC